MSSNPSSTASSTPSYPTLNPSSGAKWIKRLTQDRLGQFVGGHFGDVNLGAALFLKREDGKEFVEMEV
jgi:alpha-mannosidase